MVTSMSEFDIRNKTTIEQDIINLLKSLEENPNGLDQFASIIKVANTYVQFDSENTEPELSRFKAHQLCSKCQTDRTKGQEDQAVEVQLRFQLQICMLRTLGFRPNRNTRIWLKGLYSSLVSCVECYKGFLQVKREIGPRFLHTYEEAQVEQFLTFAEDWEERNALEIVAERNLSGDSSKRPLRPTELYAMLALAGSLAARGKKESLYDTLKSKRAYLQLAGLTEAPSGLLAMAIDEDQNIRRWLEKQATVPTMSIEFSSTKTVRKLLGQAIERKDWDGLALFLKLAPDSFKGSALPNAILACLSEDSSDPNSVLQFFHRVLEMKGRQLWEAEDIEYPLVVMTTILDNTKYRKNVLQSSSATDLFDWMKPLLASLLPPNSDREKTELSNTDEIETKTFDDAFKRIVQFLVETMQQGTVALNCREAAFGQAVSLLHHFLLLRNDYTEDVAAESARIVAQTVTLHASLFASFALRGRLPSTMETITSQSKARKDALSLLQDIFEMDCSNLRGNLLHLSDITNKYQSMYKKLIKQHSSTSERNNVSSIDEIFQNCTKTLDATPWIASDLWRESYNAFRPTDNVVLFLQPLSRLSTFVQPQISSHVITIRSQHADNASFSIYKDRLKSCLLTLTRRLRSMRGNLPQILLDISDESGLNSSASETLSTICYELADCLIQANLCPEPDIYKGAQNLVRSTFEDAETRGDCFRALLQCNPTLALEGIEQYLESFLIAASTLVEANEAAKWMILSFSDILDVLCSQTDGLLREGTPHSLVDNKSARGRQLQRLIPSIWQLMCQSIAVIFKKTPNWSKVLPHAELTAWFRDVILFASEMVEQVGIIQTAAVSGEEGIEEEEDEDIQANILVDLAIPLEEASSWFKMNDSEIVQETKEYFVKGLQCFKGKVQLPKSVKEKMIAFIDSQSKIEDDNLRVTLLSLTELSKLRHLLEPRSVIEIEDSDDDTIRIQTPPRVDTPPSSSKEVVDMKVIEKKSGKILVANTQPERIDSHEQRKLKQQKLAFQAVDAAEKRPFLSLSKPAPKPPRPQFSSTATPANRYQSASTKSSSSARTSSAFAEARRNFNANHTWKDLHRNFSRPTYSSSTRELPDPQAPAAKRTFTSAPIEAVKVQTSTMATASDSESSEEESEEDSELLGLADLVGNKKSPIKMRPKPKLPPKPPVRRTVLKEDLEERRREREREEIERKRKLRERANLRPLHRSILSWDIYADSARPPVLVNEPAPRYESAKSIYKSPKDYVSLFEPMLSLEAWAELQSAKREMMKGPNQGQSTIVVSGRSTTDSFVVFTATTQSQPGQKSNINDADIVYVREAGATTRPKCILAKVDAYKIDHARRTERITLRCCLQSDTQGMSSLITPGTSLEMGKLFTLTTMHREYEALQVMQYYDLLPSILLAKCSVRETVDEKEIHQAEVDYGVNRPQAEAILGSLKAEQGFNLIQGPPGTGKTKTICSLVAHFVQTRRAPAVAIRVGQVGAGAVIKKKILLCAPSNAAVDEVAKRVFDGVKLKNGKTIKPSVVRLGREEAMNISVKSFSLETLVERKLTSTASYLNSQPETDDFSKMQAEIRRLKDERDIKRAELENARMTKANDKIIAQLDSEFRSISVRRMALMGQLDEVKDKKQTVNRQQTADRKRIEQDVLAEADVVCATLGGAGHNMLCDLPFDFETVVIDEAAQAVELDTLIPLRYGCQRCILVGDPNQLAPTVISQEAEKLKYSKSLFVRLFNNPSNYSNLLSIQYRMHPSISKFPSAEFYEGRLTDGPGMAAATAKPWHWDPYLGPMRFFNCADSKEASARGMSLINREEATMATAIYERLRKQAHQSGVPSLDRRVGVISMYKEQIFELKRAFERVYGRGIDEVVDFNTVDGFQGQEKDTIILSCVRSDGIGFLNDFRRVNVAITRAKSNLFIVGNANNLERSGKGTIWPRLIEMARKEGCYMDVTCETFRRPALPAPASASNANLTQRGANGSSSAASTSSNGTSVPSQPGKKAVSPVKRKASATFSPLDVIGKANHKRVHVDGREEATASTASAIAVPRPPTPKTPSRPRPPIQTMSRQSSSSSFPSRPPHLHPRPPTRPNNTARPATSGAVVIHPPGPVANPPQSMPRPVQLHRPPSIRPPVFSSQEGPSEKAKSSVFMKKPLRQGKPKGK